MPTPDKQLSAEQSRQVAETIREEIARRRISRQIAGRTGQAQPFDPGEGAGRPPSVYAGDHGAARAGARRLPAQGRRMPPAAAPVNGDIAPDSLGAYSRRAVTWLEGAYVTVRPSFGDKEAIYAYRTEIAWDARRLVAGVSRRRTARCGLHPVRRSRRSEPVRLHLSRHQPPRPAPADHGVAADHHRARCTASSRRSWPDAARS